MGVVQKAPLSLSGTTPTSGSSPQGGGEARYFEALKPRCVNMLAHTGEGIPRLIL